MTYLKLIIINYSLYISFMYTSICSNFRSLTELLKKHTELTDEILAENKVSWDTNNKNISILD